MITFRISGRRVIKVAPSRGEAMVEAIRGGDSTLLVGSEVDDFAGLAWS